MAFLETLPERRRPGHRGQEGRALKAAARRERSRRTTGQMSVQVQGRGLTTIAASGPITSWQRDGETMGTVAHFGLIDQCRR